ncbi:MAG: hypothetical protein GX271_08535 [Clostridiales bacterium]|nr:hypothetical protein [Clostridiales bacterium]
MENNKKTTIFIMLVIAFIVISTGCNKYEETENVPTLQLEYQEDEKIETMTIRHGTATWRYKERGLDADAPHPLDSVAKTPQVRRTDDLSEIKLNFSSPPSSYSVKCWTDDYIDNNEAYYDFYEEVKVSDDTIAIPQDEVGYIYLVEAIWPQGKAHYGFYVVASEY